MWECAVVITVDRKKLANAIAKVAVDAATFSFGGVAKGVVDVASAFSKEGEGAPTAIEGAHLLVQRAVYFAAMRTIQDFASVARALVTEAKPEEIEAEITGLASASPLELTAGVFAHPENWPALDVMIRAFAQWMEICQVPDEHRSKMERYFREEIILGLAAELRERLDGDYRALVEEVTRSAPLDEVARQALNWRAYRARLVEAVRQPMRSIAPEKISRSLADLYIPLRAIVERRIKVGNRSGAQPNSAPQLVEQLVWLDEVLDSWIAAAEKADAVRTLSGEPGAGKSSSCAMLAARLARQGRRVLLVPLGRLDYHGDAWSEVVAYVKEILGHDALNGRRNSRTEPLLLILDGLDELAKVGDTGADAVGQFVTALDRRISRINDDGTHILLLLVGRPGAVDRAGPFARTEGARLHAVRFRLEEPMLSRLSDQPLAEIDQSTQWWRRFDPSGEMLGALAVGKSERVDELTSQPLLNWLLAQILTLEDANVETVKGTHDLYSRLFGHVMNRVHRERHIEPIDAVEQDKLCLMLEEVAVAAWQAGGDRVVSLKEVEKRLRAAKLDDDLRRIADQSDSALSALLDSFFCRAFYGAEHKVVEFTHKSFGQFLVARRLVRQMEHIYRVLSYQGGPYQRDAELRAWIDLCGAAEMDLALLDFLRAEVAAVQPCHDLVGWRKIMAELVEFCFEEGMPMAAGPARTVERIASNAEVSLLAALSATVIVTSEVTGYLPKPLNTDTGSTIHRLLGTPVSNSVARRCLNSISLRDAIMVGADLRYLDLSGMDLGGAILSNAIFSNSNMEGIKLENTDLSLSKLSNAKMDRASLVGANLFMTDLSSASLRNANLENAVANDVQLSRADLSNALLRFATLVDADLMDAVLRYTDLTGANLTNAHLEGADLAGANLTNVNLSGAYLANADLINANLTNANLSGAYLANADLSNAKLINANLTDANLDNANISGAELSEADLNQKELYS